MNEAQQVVSMFISIIAFFIGLVLLRMAMEISQFLKFEKAKIILQIEDLKRKGMSSDEIKMTLSTVWRKIPKDFLHKLN